MKERYKLWLAPDGACLLYDMGIPSVPIIVQFPSDYPGGAEAAARAEAARLNALEAKKPPYVATRSQTFVETWFVGVGGENKQAALFYPCAPGGAQAAAEKLAREWNEEAQ